MNNQAAAAFRTNAPRFPVGAVIVKQKTVNGYTGNDGKRVVQDNGVGGMIKRAPGFDPKHGDWEYFYFENPKKIENGRIASCVKCHDSAKNKDYVFGTWNRAGGD
ncbi:MAG TPA: cytochrome P460 family protein [Verrucomicrobiae bacterium]